MRKFANFYTVSGNPNDPNAPVTLQLDSRNGVNDKVKFATVFTFRDEKTLRKMISDLSAMLPCDSVDPENNDTVESE